MGLWQNPPKQTFCGKICEKQNKIFAAKNVIVYTVPCEVVFSARFAVGSVPRECKKNITNPICVYYHIICVVKGVSYKTASLYKVNSFYDPITGTLCILCKPSSE